MNGDPPDRRDMTGDELDDAIRKADIVELIETVPEVGTTPDRRKPVANWRKGHEEPRRKTTSRHKNWTLRLVLLLVYTVLSWAGINKAIELADGRCFGPFCITDTEAQTKPITKENYVE